MSKSSSLTPRLRFWVEHLRACVQRKQSLSAYAAEHGLRVGNLYEAKSRLKRLGALPTQPRPLSFVRVDAPVAAAPTSCLCRVVLPNGVTVDAAGVELAAVLSAAARLP